jgi:FKBP-type peptidyl-prolyl cis-trans isomerase
MNGENGEPSARHMKAQLQMKLRRISFFVAGLLSFGGMAQAQPVATNLPAPQPGNPPAAVSAASAAPAEAVSVEAPDKGQFSHALGIYYSQGLTNDMINKMGLDIKGELDMGQFMEAFSNVVGGSAMTINIEDLKKILRQHDSYHTNQINIMTNKLIATGPENKVKSEKFMDDIAKTPGVTKLPSGVVYKVIKDGEGVKPNAGDAAVMTFHVTRMDGTEVWKVEHIGAQISNQLLPPGIREVLPMMKGGSHWTVYLPYAAAFGDKPGIPNAKEGFLVGPFSAVVFDLEVESVQPRPTSMPGMAPPRAGMPPTTAPTAATTPTSPTTSHILRVPSGPEMEKGEKPHEMTDAEVEAEKKAEAARQALTNSPATAAASTNTNSGSPR